MGAGNTIEGNEESSDSVAVERVRRPSRPGKKPSKRIAAHVAETVAPLSGAASGKPGRTSKEQSLRRLLAASGLRAVKRRRLFPSN